MPTALATAVLIVLLVWFYLWQLTLGEAGATRAAYALGLTPAVVSGHAQLPAELRVIAPPWTLFSTLFVHLQMVPLALGVSGLCLFARRVEHAAGALGVVLIFFISGMSGGLAEVALMPAAATPVTGAANAIAGLAGASLLLVPRTWPWVIVWLAATVLASAVTDSAAPATPALLLAFITGAVMILFAKRRGVALFA